MPATHWEDLDSPPKTPVPRRRLFSLLVLVPFLAACQTSADGDTDPGSADGESAPADEQSSVTIAVAGDITTTDDHVQAGIIDRNVLQNLHDGLVRRDPETGELLPHIATEWTLSDDQLVWTIKLRDDVTFHNGDHLTADDLKATIERINDPELASQQAAFFSGINEVVVVDDYTAEFHLAEPDPMLMLFTERLTVYPRSWIDEIGHEPYAGDEPVGAGAYQLAEWSRDNRIVFEAFDDYFLGRPEIDQVIFRPIPDEAARVAALRAGEVDIVPSLSTSQVNEVESDSDVRVVSSLSLGRVRISIDRRVEPFDVKEVRQAINHAIDVDTIIEQLIPDAVRIPAALVPQEVGFNPDLEPYPYDPERARQLLSEAGFPDGIGPFELSVNPTYAQSEEAAQAVQAYLAEAGIQTEVQVYDPGDFNTRKSEKEENPTGLGPLHFDGHLGGNTFHGYHFYHNVVNCDLGTVVHAGYGCNDEVNTMTQEAAEIWPTDPDRSTELFQEAEEILQEDAWAGFLYQVPALSGVRANLEWEPSPAAPLQMRFAHWAG